MKTHSSQINPAQKLAIEFNDGHLLVVAGPGTGKTHTLTHRIAEKAKQLKGDEKILAITFTNKAADEMHKRLKNQLGGLDEKITIGTFHSFCWQLLRPLKEFHLLDEEGIIEVCEKVWPDLSKKERKLLYNKISWSRSVEFRQKEPEVLKQFNQYLEEHNLLDFDGLLLTTLRTLEQDEQFRSKIQNTYKYIFVDEYQDINALQHIILKMLITGKNEITAIGDPNQAIYGFRGSDVGFFQSFQKDFPDATIFYLNDNYRSAQNILSASSQVIATSTIKVPELTATLFEQGQLIVHSALTEKAESEYIVHQIEKMVGGTSMFSQDSERVGNDDQGEVSFGDIAILYRLHSQTRALKEAFERSGIPYHVCNEENDDDVCPKRGKDVNIEAEKVSLLTLHSAKGLEFPVVFILGCEENLLPLNLRGLSSKLDEERRLFYVGMTRAKHRLYFTCAKKRMLFGKNMNNSLSRFVSDIEEQLKNIEESKRHFKKTKQEEQISLF